MSYYLYLFIYINIKMSNYSSNSVIPIHKIADTNNGNIGGPWTQTYFANTWVYWNNYLPMSNIGNPVIFKYTYTSSSSQSINVYVLCPGYCQFYLNGTYIQTFSEYGSTTNVPVANIPVVNTTYIFEFRCVYLGTTSPVAMPGFACSVTNNASSTTFFTTLESTVGWSLGVGGYFNTNNSFTELFVPLDRTNYFNPVFSRNTTLPTDDWFPVSLSTTGQYGIVASVTGNVYITNNYGVTWTRNTTVNTTSGYRSTAMSSSGQYVLLAADGGNLRRSDNYGVSFTTTGPSGNNLWLGAAISSAGQYGLAMIFGGGLYTSNNYGVTWTLNTSAPTSVNWHEVPSLSSTGQYGLAPRSGGALYTSSDYSTTWTQRTTAPTNAGWIGTALSSSGQYALAAVDGGSIWRSVNYGVSWTAVYTVGGLRCVAFSSSGQYAIASSYNGGRLHTSMNYGATWSINTSIPTGNYDGLALSSSGQYVLAAGFTSGSIYTAKISSSVLSSGKNYVVDDLINYDVLDQYNPATWSDVTIPNCYNFIEPVLDTASFVQNLSAPTNRIWESVALSSSGQYALACEFRGEFDKTETPVYRSANYGVSWSVTGVSYKTYAIAISGEGQFGLMCSNVDRRLYYSSNYGSSWVNSSVSSKISSVAISYSGQYGLSNEFYNNGQASVRRSTDYGITWTAVLTTPDGAGVDGNTVEISSSGQYAYACFVSRGIWRSSNFGVSWTKNTSASTSGNFTSVAISSSGQYVLACGGANSIWRSVDYGVTWSRNTSADTTSWKSVALSSSGQYALASATGSIWYSSNYGVTWTKNTSASTFSNWLSVALSSSGQYALAGAQNGSIYRSVITSSITQTAQLENRFNLSKWNPLNPANFTKNLTAQTNSTWTGVALSSSGQYALACAYGVNTNGSIWLSTNYGITWTRSIAANVTYYWTGIAVSSSGQYGLACSSLANLPNGNGSIWTSSNYGVTWTRNTANSINTTSDWQAVALSSSGQYGLGCALITGGNGSIWRSINYGVTWTRNTSAQTNLDWQGVALSSSGQYALACPGRDTFTAGVVNSGRIWRSTDYGLTWAQNTSANTSSNWQSVALSSSGQYALACASSQNSGGSIWYSSNYGVTWTKNTSANTLSDWLSVALSSSGQYALASAGPTNNGSIWYSSNYGVTWTKNTSAQTNSTWGGVALSSSGQYALACADTTNSNGSIWYSQNF